MVSKRKKKVLYYSLHYDHLLHYNFEIIVILPIISTYSASRVIIIVTLYHAYLIFAV